MKRTAVVWMLLVLGGCSVESRDASEIAPVDMRCLRAHQEWDDDTDQVYTLCDEMVPKEQ